MNIYIIIIFLVIILCSVFNNGENFQVYLGQPTKCFSCEAQLPNHLKYLGGPTKCFDCEKDIINRYGVQFADLAQPTKCFSCESQFVQNPVSH